METMHFHPDTSQQPPERVTGLVCLLENIDSHWLGRLRR